MGLNTTLAVKEEYLFTYSDTFLYDGRVEFKYRASSKLIEGNLVNGLFIFSIDGVD